MKNIELDQLLYGESTPAEVSNFFQNGEFYNEDYNVEAINKHLLTEDQRLSLFKANISIYDLLNGRTLPEHESLKNNTFESWNKKLGFKCFGY